jgi:hypothetical protein
MVDEEMEHMRRSEEKQILHYRGKFEVTRPSGRNCSIWNNDNETVFKLYYEFFYRKGSLAKKSVRLVRTISSDIEKHHQYLPSSV